MSGEERERERERKRESNRVAQCRSVHVMAKEEGGREREKEHILTTKMLGLSRAPPRPQVDILKNKIYRHFQ